MAQINTKWPALVIKGDPVTAEQADDILLRTWNGYLMTNDRRWYSEVCRIMNIQSTDWITDYEPMRECYQRLKGLALNYLGNHQIMSSYIGGPHGWCSWNGAIGCDSYNIGKWPSVEEVEEDLTLIAAAWPFLKFRMQLWEEEGAGSLCGEWSVAEGKAMEVEPGDRLRPAEFNAEKAVANLFLPGNEQGISPLRLGSAYQRVLAAHWQPSE